MRRPKHRKNSAREKQRKYFDKTFENSFKTIMYHMIISGRQTFCNQKGGENQIKSI